MSTSIVVCPARAVAIGDLRDATESVLAELFAGWSGEIPRVRIMTWFPNGRELTGREIEAVDYEVAFMWDTRHAVLMDKEGDYLGVRHPAYSAGSYALLLAAGIAAARSSGALVQTLDYIVDGLPTANEWAEYEPDTLLAALTLHGNVRSLDEGALEILGRTAYGEGGWNPDAVATP